MIKSLNKTLPKARKPLNRPLRVQDCLRTRRGHLPARAHPVGAAALHPLVPVGQGGKFGLGRYGAISGRKRAIFGDLRLPDQENFGQGLHSGRRREVPWGRDPRIRVVHLKRLPHSVEISRLLLLQGRLPGLSSEGQVLKFL